MQKLAEICVRRPVFATVIVLALVVVGGFSYFQLGVDRFPKIEFPWVTVSTVLPGAAPEEVETEITDKIEEAVNTISGIDEMMSTSSENVSVVQIGFVLEKDADVAAQEVRDRINTILGDLPADAEPPIIQKIESDAAPVIGIALSGPATERQISEYADKTLRRRFETVNGVGQVVIVGSRPRQINVVADVDKLASLGLTSADLVNALRTQNVQVPGGRVESGVRELTLRTYGRVDEPKDFASLPIAVRGGETIRVRDVARIDDSVAEAESVATVDGKPAVVLMMRKQSGENTVAVIEAVKQRVEELRPQLPEGWKMEIVRDQSEFIIAALDAVKEHLILGSIFAAFIVWLFLRRFRPTLIAAIAIPSSLVATFGAMAFMGFTLNVLTLLALTLAVGIVIDDAVVVLENVFRHMEEKNLTPMQAAVSGTKEVGLAVLATSLSLIAVFLPVAFMGGIVGRFMNSFGVTMAFAIAVSLLVAFTLTPMLSSRWLTQKDTAADQSSKSTGFYSAIEGFYMKMLRWSMAHRWVIVLVMVVVFLSTIPLFMVANKNFLPTDDEGQFGITVRVPEGASLDATQRVLQSIDRQVQKYPEVETTVLTIGDDLQQTRNLGTIYVKLSPPGDRDADQFDVQQRVREEILPQYDQLDLRVQVAPINEFGGGVDAEIMYWLGGPDLDQLDTYAQTLMDKIRDMPGVTDLDTNYVVGKPELGIRIDREKAAELGVGVRDLATTLNVMVGGQQATSYYEGGEEYEVHVRADKTERSDASSIAQMEVPSATLGTVRLGDVVTMDEGTGPSVINRINRRRQVIVMANMLPGYSAQTVMDELEKAAAELNMPAEYSSGFTGRSREQGKAMVNFLLAFVLSIIFMYLILAAQFESWIHPVTILLSLPMTVPFALLSIVVLNQSINIFSMLGILVLFGIVKKNAILQIDHTNQMRAAGHDRLEAILIANRDRLRPILMTTLAFVAGMIPLVVSSGTGAGTNRAIASTIMGGQTMALMLTLLGTPVAYSIFDDWASAPVWKKLGRKLGMKRGGKVSAPPTPVEG